MNPQDQEREMNEDAAEAQDNDMDHAHASAESPVIDEPIFEADGEVADEVAGEVASEATGAEPSAEAAEEAPVESAPTPKKPAKSPKRLTAGRAATSAASDRPTLKGSGVATYGALAAPSRPRRGKGGGADALGTGAISGAVTTEGEIEEFDPAKDLPMYREGMNWFVLRVASNKENYVRETLLKKVQIEGMQDLVGRIMVPTEKTKTLKGGRHRITETKLYPGYVFVEMRLEPDGRIPQDVFFLIKETTGVGDFVGTAGRPTPMAPTEVEKMLFDSRKPEEAPTVKMEFAKGDHVKITDGAFENIEGTVDETVPEKGIVRVLVTIFGRQAPIELEYWQLAKTEG